MPEEPMHPELFILRHGETEWNRQGRFQGQKDSKLTQKGELQAQRQKELLSSLAHRPETVFVSPLGRAVQTARLIFGASYELTIDDRLKEIGFGAWEGLTRDQLEKQHGDLFDDELWHFNSPGGESYDSIRDRVTDFVNSISAPAVIVTHGITSIVMRGYCMKLPICEALLLEEEQGCIFHLLNGQQTILR